jgi:hypothetical protein
MNNALLNMALLAALGGVAVLVDMIVSARRTRRRNGLHRVAGPLLTGERGRLP